MYSNQKILIELIQKLWTVLRFVLIIGMAFVLMYPILYMISIAFRDPVDMLDPSIIWLSKNLTLSNFTEAAQALKFTSSLINSLLIGGASSLLQVISCTLVAYGFARYRFKLRKVLFACVMLTIIVPPQVTILPLFLLFKDFSSPIIGPLLKSLAGVNLSVNLLDKPLVFYLQAVFGLGLRSGLCIFLLRQFFKGLPAELEEAAEIDGCGPYQTFGRIMLPNAVPMLLTVFLFSFIWYWNDYYTTNIFISDNMTLAIALSQLRISLATQTENVTNMYESITQMQAGCLMFVAPLLLLYVFTQRYFVESIDRSGLVG